MKKRLAGFLLFAGLAASGAVRAETHALLMFIGDYRAGIPKLEGVQHDVASARSIARLMGVRDENTRVLQNDELTLEGIQNAFDELERRVAYGDRVFIYYSGHGGRQYVSGPEERCAESLVTVNGNFFIDVELERRLQKLSGRTQKIIAMFDACHSGGVTTRAVSSARYTPKYWSKGEQDACIEPVNLLTRSIRKASDSAGSGGKNFVYIAAAKNNEVSLDDPDKGGFATLAWAQCMSGEAVDTDGSGGLTADEIRVCAQQKIDERTKGLPDILPQHISIVGNPDLVMTLASGNPEVAHGSVAPTPVPPVPASQVSAPPVPIPQQPVQMPVAESGAPATLLDIFNGRDDRRTVEIMPDKSRLKIGSDKFSFRIRSSHEGYLYLMMVGTDGKTFDLLFPNRLDGNNYIQAGQTVQFPRPNWKIIAQGPAGKDHILAIVSDAPRDLTSLQMVNAGPFSIVNVTPGGKRSIQMATTTRAAANEGECGDSSGRRNLAVERTCSDAYGAALTAVQELE